MRLTFLAKRGDELQPMMGYIGSLQQGCRRFNQIFGYEIFWVLINKKILRRAVPYGDMEWRLTDDFSAIDLE